MGWYAAKYVGANRDLSSRETHVLLTIADHADDAGFTFVGQIKIGQKVKKERETVNRIIASLVKKGCLTKMANRFNRRQRGYLMNFERIAQGQRFKPPKKPFYCPEREHWIQITKSSRERENLETADESITYQIGSTSDQIVTYSAHGAPKRVTKSPETVDESAEKYVTETSPQSLSNQKQSASGEPARLEESELAEAREKWSQTRQLLKAKYPDIWTNGLSAISQRVDGNLHASLPDAELAARYIGSDLKSAGFVCIYVKGTDRFIAL